MKPRTKLQIRVYNLSKQIPKLSKQQELWAQADCLEHRGFASKRYVLCMDCGKKFSPELVKWKRAVCPHCHTSLIIKESRKRTDKQVTYFAIASVVEDFQVIAFYELFANYKAGEKAHYWSHEIMEHWVLPNGQREVIGRCHSLSWYQDSWTGDWSIRDKKNPKFDVYPYRYHPSSKFKPQYKKIGIDKNLRGLTFIEAIKILPDYPQAETLLKAKRYELLRAFSDYNYKHSIVRFWPSVKICLRNNYRVNDIGLWFDYLDLLEYFGKDLRNAQYVCPDNLKAVHDKLVEKKRERQRRQELERKRKEVEEAQVYYAEKIKNYLGLQFSDGMITVKVLETVKEFMEEGDTLKHCVFTNEYYTREDSLILSARINDTPVETIEVSLSKAKILQSRGLQNEQTAYHNKIVKLVKKNLHHIKKLSLKQSA